MGDDMAVIVFVGAYAYAQTVLEGLPEPPMGFVTETEGAPRWQDIRPPHAIEYADVQSACLDLDPDLVIVAGWRKLVPILAPTIGFHSAKLPEYPGRAPVANAILRGDTMLTNTMLWLDEGVDTGDIIDQAAIRIGKDPDAIYRDIGRTSVAMLRDNWQGSLDGSAPRTPQDMAKRGPLTPADAWKRL